MKKIIPILFASALMLVGCGNEDNTPKLKHLEITNKEALTADWYEGEDERKVLIQSDPEMKIKDWGPSGKLRLKLSDPEVLHYDGSGAVISPTKAGTCEVSVTYYGRVYDKVTITVGDLRPAPAVLNDKTLQEIKSSTITDVPVQAYHGTYTVASIAYDKYGNMTFVDDSLEEGYECTVYGSSYNMPINWVKPGKYATDKVNPADFLTAQEGKANLWDIEPGDSVTCTLLPFNYSGGGSNPFEMLVKIESFAKASRPDLTDFSVDAIEITEHDVTKIKVTTSPEDASKLFDFSVAEEYKELISVDPYSGELSALKAGDAQLHIKSRYFNVEKDIAVHINEYVDEGLVETPVDGMEVAVSILKTSHMYWNGDSKNTYYGDVTNEISEAEFDILRQVEGGWALQRPADLEKDAGKYLGIAISGTHVNFKWDSDTPLVGVWNEELHTLVFTVNGNEYVIASQSTYSSISGCKVSQADGSAYYACHFHTRPAA